MATLVVDQVLFDNGRNKGEREFAIADVEVAAVNLAVDCLLYTSPSPRD